MLQAWPIGTQHVSPGRSAKGTRGNDGEYIPASAIREVGTQKRPIGMAVYGVVRSLVVFGGGKPSDTFFSVGELVEKSSLRGKARVGGASVI